MGRVHKQIASCRDLIPADELEVAGSICTEIIVVVNDEHALVEVTAQIDVGHVKAIGFRNGIDLTDVSDPELAEDLIVAGAIVDGVFALTLAGGDQIAFISSCAVIRSPVPSMSAMRLPPPPT